MSKKKQLFITDPYENLAPYREDTTLRLIEASRALGNECFLASYLAVSLDATTLSAFSYECGADPTNRIEIKNGKLMNLKMFDEIHYRVDPPVDERYLAPLHLMKAGLSLDDQKKVLNPIDALCTWNEKTIPLMIPDTSPDMVVSSDWEVLYGFGKSYGKTVLKPLGGFQSRGVELLDWSDEISQKMSQLKIKELSHDFTVPVVVQEFLPEISKGEVRVWYVGGKPIACVRRHPPKDEFRIGTSTKVTAEKLSTVPMNLNRAVQNFLTTHSIRFAAVDWIGEKISDFNITSPGLLIEMEQVLKQDLAKLCF